LQSRTRQRQHPPVHGTKNTGSSLSRTELSTAIEEVETELQRLALERAEAEARLGSLSAALAALDRQGSATVTTGLGPKTHAEKVELFRQLFRGRPDLYPTRFISKKTHKPGYAPVCSNKFVDGLCQLPAVKCGECANQAFRPVDNAAVLAHLRGKHIMGVYPLLRDETCWFLAVDFDKHTWTEDTRAFVQTARSYNLPAAVERSRSGNGAHVWFFFSAPVAAATARKMGCHLITETMARRHELSMSSYDRLFPSQDTMPRGGFGNLIALPLQREPRQKGNSVFVDDDFVPFPDEQQWTHLASVARIEPATVERIAAEATGTGTVIGVQQADFVTEEDAVPWALLPSRRSLPLRFAEPLPARVHAVLAQGLFVEKAGLPSPLLNQVKRLAAFQNPEFYKKQSMRLSTATTPRVIECAQEHPDHIELPRGCRPELEELLRTYDVALVVEDRRSVGAPTDLRFHGHLTSLQEQAARALLAHDVGVFVAPPGVGKTVVGTYLIAARACSTLVLVHRKPLLDQWRAQLSTFLSIDPKLIGQMGGGKRAATGKLDVAMMQSLVHTEAVVDGVASYGQVIVDECHHLPAVSFERVLAKVKARYVVGLTATPQRRDGHHPITRMQLGPVRFSVSAKSQAGQRPFEHRLFVRETAFRSTATAQTPSIQDIYSELTIDSARNELILSDVIHALQDGRSPLLLTERKEHLDYFAVRLRHIARNLIVLQGGMSAKAEKTVRSQFGAIPPDEERLVLATGRYIGEGFDDARLDTLFLAMPVSWKGTLVQYTGRLHRMHPGKREVCIFDYVDREVPMLLRMFEKRLRGYRSIGYARSEAPPGYENPIDDYAIEYDDDALAHFGDENPIE
jgi:superfamily II DNA or RNA helicase